MTQREQILDYLANHPNCTTFDCQDGTGCSVNYIRQVFKSVGYKAPIIQPSRRKYIEGQYLGENGVFFKQRLDSKNGIFICPYDGVEFTGNIGCVAKGLIKSCGCLHSRVSRESTFIDLTGQRFGKLVVEYCLPYSTEDNRAIWHCKCDCGGEKDVVGKLLRSGHTHSCGCSNSKGEVLVREILKTLKVTFEEQKTFDGFVNSRKVPYKYDFYLPDYNCCIEYDGEQHYTGWAKKEESLKSIKRNDEIKNDFCLSNGITLVRLPYFCYNSITKDTIKDLIERVNNGSISGIYTYRED